MAVRRQAAKNGVDVFRVFDSLNWVDNMRVVMDAVLETGALCEGARCVRSVRVLKQEVGLPIRFHIHDISGIAAASVPAAMQALSRRPGRHRERQAQGRGGHANDLLIELG